jgi:hypothetical protein
MADHEAAFTVPPEDDQGTTEQPPTQTTDEGARQDNDDDEDDTTGFFTKEARLSASGGPGGHSGSKVHQSHEHGVSKSFAAMDAADGEREGKLKREMFLPLRFVIDKLEHGVDSSELYRDLIVFVPFLVLFIFFFLAGRDIEANFYVLQGLRDRLFMGEFTSVDVQLDTYRQQVLAGERLWIEMDKNYAGIGNGGDWADWFNVVVIPTLFDCQNPDTSYSFNAPTGQNYGLGALRVRTQRVRSDSCDVRTELYPDNATLLQRTCYGASSQDLEETVSPRCNLTNPLTGATMFEYKKCGDVPGAPTSAVEGIYHCGGYMFDIPFSATCNQARAFGALLTDASCGLIDNWATRFVMTEFFLYTPANDVFHSVKLFQEVNVAGLWTPQWTFRSFGVWSETQVVQTIVDIVFLLYVLYYWFDFFFQLVKTVKSSRADQQAVNEGNRDAAALEAGYGAQADGAEAAAQRDSSTKQSAGVGAALGYLTSLWNILELANLVTFIVVFGFRFGWMSVSSDAKDALKLPMPGAYPPYLDRLLVLYETQVYGNSVNTMFVFLKLLKYVRLNPRLNVLTRTIAACQQSIFGVLVLFVTIIVGYAITGYTLFGVNVARFRNVGVSISSLVRMLVGDVDYEELRNENRFLAGLFFWTYMILALFLLLNFLIAIISESFAAVSGKAFSTPFEELLVRWIQSTKAFLKPANISRVCRNCVANKSEASLLRKVLRELRQRNEQRMLEQLKARDDERAAQREALRAEGDDFAEEMWLNDAEDDDDETQQVLIKYGDLELMVTDEIEAFNDLSEHYWAYTWDELMNEYDDARKTSEEVTKRRMAETVKLGVDKVLGNDLAKIKKLDEALKNVEAEVQRMLSALEGPAA